jgi:hypothetical protein
LEPNARIVSGSRLPMSALGRRHRASATAAAMLRVVAEMA